jgi:O-antigen ligase
VLLLAWALGYALTSDSWELVITAVGWLALMGTILLDPVAGLALWVIASPFAPYVHLNLSLGAGIPDLGLDRLAAGFFCIVLLAQVARRRRRLAPFTLLDGAVLLFAIAISLSSRSALRGTFRAIQNIFNSYLVPLLVYFLAKNLVRGRQAMRWILGGLGVIASYLVILIAHEHLTGNAVFVSYGRVGSYTENLQRINSLLQNPAYTAMVLNMILPFSLRATLRSTDIQARRAHGLVSVILVGAVVSLYNRAGWLSALLVIIVSALYYPRLRRWLLVVLALVIPLVALSWGVISSSVLFSERLTYDLSVGYRMRAIEAGAQLLASEPVFGIGFGSFSPLVLARELIPRASQNYWVPTTHNTYLDVLVSAGIFGLVPYVVMFIAAAWQSVRIYRLGLQHPTTDRSLLLALWCVLLVFIVSTATFDVVAAPFAGMVFWLITGAVLGSQSWPAASSDLVTRRSEAV